MSYINNLNRLFNQEQPTSLNPQIEITRNSTLSIKKLGRPKKVIVSSPPIVKYLTINECPHPVDVKYITKHGLACADCLVEDDFHNYPRFKERLKNYKRKAIQARKNFGYGGTGNEY